MPIEVKHDEHIVIVDDREIYLTPVLWSAFECLYSRKSRIVTRQYLFDYVWGQMRVDNPDHTIRVALWTLRKKFRGTPISIETMYGFGVRMRDG